jgi:hypothetical protein
MSTAALIETLQALQEITPLTTAAAAAAGQGNADAGEGKLAASDRGNEHHQVGAASSGQHLTWQQQQQQQQLVRQLLLDLVHRVSQGEQYTAVHSSTGRPMLTCGMSSRPADDHGPRFPWPWCCVTVS